jgi:hypothetical protein
MFFIFGRNGSDLLLHQERSFLLEKETYNDFVELDAYERYETLYNKSVAWLQYASSNLKCEYVMKVDEDTYLRPLPLMNFLSSISDSNALIYFGHYWWKRSSVIKDPSNLWYMFDQCPHEKFPYYMSGPALGMSMELAARVAAESLSHPSYRCEDVGIGILVDSLAQNSGLSVQYNCPDNFFKQTMCTLDTVFDLLHFSIGFNFYQRYFDDLKGNFFDHVKRGTPMLGKHFARVGNVFTWPILSLT